MEWMGMIIVDNEFHERRVCRNKDLRRTLFVLCFKQVVKKRLCLFLTQPPRFKIVTPFILEILFLSGFGVGGFAE